jgi:hypothetical protein
VHDDEDDIGFKSTEEAARDAAIATRPAPVTNTASTGAQDILAKIRARQNG